MTSIIVWASALRRLQEGAAAGCPLCGAPGLRHRFVGDAAARI